MAVLEDSALADERSRIAKESRSGSTEARMSRHIEEGLFEFSETRIARFTEEEILVLELLGEGMTNWEIARQLGIALRDVKQDVKNLVKELGFTGRTEAAAYASFYFSF